jgi:fumarate hydratase class II
VPLTWGQEVSGWISQLDHGIDRLDAALDGLYELALGGTAVGTGLNAPAGFGERAVAALAAASGLPLRPAANRFEAIAASDAVVFASGALKTLAASLMKIANDVRLLASGPRAGIGELRIPANEPGSSIMPGKVNPTQCEALAMVCAQVFGNDAAITVGGASGLLQLNVARPLMIFNLLRSIRLLADAVASFHHRCVVGMEPLRAPTAEHVAASLMLVTALVPRLGYDAAARIATRAHAEGTTLKAAAIALGLLDAARFDALVRPLEMTGRGPAEDPEPPAA